MINLNTNLSSLIVQNSLKESTLSLNQAIERMSTGYKINHASDNAANYSILTSMNTKLNAYQVAEENAAMGLDLLATAEGSLDQINDKLTRLRALAEQAANGTYGEQSLNAINAEANALIDEINRIYSTTEYNGMTLFDEQTAVAQLALNGGVAQPQAFAVPVVAAEINVDENMRVHKQSSFTNGGTYYITDTSDLDRLAYLVDNGVDTTGAIFELANDITFESDGSVNFAGIGDRGSANSFKGVFNGNGHVISGLVVTEGFFGGTYDAEINDLGINATSRGAACVGILAGDTTSTDISNCYTEGSILPSASSTNAGGLVGNAVGGSIINSYSTANVYSDGATGGLFGIAEGVQLSYCYSSGNVEGSLNAGQLAGYSMYANINNCYSTSSVVGGSSVGFIGAAEEIRGSSNFYDSTKVSSIIGDDMGNDEFSAEALPTTQAELETKYDTMGFNTTNGWELKDGSPVLDWQIKNVAATPTPTPTPTPNPGTMKSINLQVGIYGDSNSQIILNTGFSISGVEELRSLGLDNEDYLGKIDALLTSVSDKATHYGAVSNRLESVLEEISIKYDNLVSSRSTIRDADIAEVSSNYIQQQILQQASATLLATANQSPSIALQLI